MDILDVVRARSELSAFRASLKIACMDNVLAGSKKLTLFAPQNEAFARFREEDFDRFLEDPGLLVRLLMHHILEGTVLGASFEYLRRTGTLEGSELSLAGRACLKAGGTRVLERDILCANGVIHVVEQVLLPPSLKRFAPLRPSLVRHS